MTIHGWEGVYRRNSRVSFAQFGLCAAERIASELVIAYISTHDYWFGDTKPLVYINREVK